MAQWDLLLWILLLPCDDSSRCPRKTRFQTDTAPFASVQLFSARLDSFLRPLFLPPGPPQSHFGHLESALRLIANKLYRILEVLSFPVRQKEPSSFNICAIHSLSLCPRHSCHRFHYKLFSSPLPTSYPPFCSVSPSQCPFLQRSKQRVWPFR